MKTHASRLMPWMAVLFIESGPCTLAATLYVDLESPSPAAPYTSWASAATNIQDAVSLAASTDTVLVADGTYFICSEILVTNNIVLQSVNGPETTIVDGGHATRCFNLGSNECVISGFTIRSGFKNPPSGSWSGGGVFCLDGSPVVSNCVLRDNYSFLAGGGMHGGRAFDCTFEHNEVDQGVGGGLGYGAAYNCTFTNNVHGAMVSGVAYHCTFIDSIGGGGLWDGTAYGCVFAGNRSFLNGGGGMTMGTAYNSVFLGNQAYEGGGMRDGAAFNCIFLGNQADSAGGAKKGGRASNCTFAGNRSVYGPSGGMQGGEAYNCILMDNTDAWGDGNLDGMEVVNYCDAPELVHGQDGNITNAPMFVASELGDFRLRFASPCIDAGTNGMEAGEFDLDGDPRIVDGDLKGGDTIDMGAYEFQIARIDMDLVMPALNLGNRGRTPVVVFSTDAFDTASIDPATVRLAGASPVHFARKDVNGDGRVDLVLQFRTQDFGIADDDTEVALVGQNYEGRYIAFTGSIKKVPPQKKKTKNNGKGSLPQVDTDPPKQQEAKNHGKGAVRQVDSDDEGLPDFSKSPYFGRVMTGLCANGVNSLLEASILGLDPTNAASSFRVFGRRAGHTGFVIGWDPCVGNRRYTVLWAAELSGPFVPLASGIEFPQNCYTDTLHQAMSSGFYKIVVEPK